MYMKTKKCLECGHRFISHGRNQKYCNPQCWRDAHNKKSLKPKIVHICVICGKQFLTQYSRRKWCSNQCYTLYFKTKQRRKSTPKTAICPVCNNSFIINTGNKTYCSKKCRILINQKRNRILHNLRVRLYSALKGNNKSSSTLKLLDCSIDELWNHLESQFQPGMTRENYGQWHVDHIKPCASFDFSDHEQQKQCFHYTNLQPLWARDNIQKGKKNQIK